MSGGLAKKKFTNNKITNLYFMSSERVLAQLDFTKEQTMKACDIWSVGVILYFFYFGVMPYRALNTNKLVKQIKNTKIEFRSP